jgi:hypothetical protein
MPKLILNSLGLANHNTLEVKVMEEEEHSHSPFGPESFARAFSLMVKTMKTNTLSSLFSLLILLSIYIVWESFHKDMGIMETIKYEFLTTEADQQTQEISAETARQTKVFQKELKLNAAADKVINGILSQVLIDAPGSARVRLAIVHEGVFSTAGSSMMKFSVTHAQAAPGRAVGTPIIGASLSEWSNYLPLIINNPSCTLVKVANLTVSTAVERISSMGTTWFSACSVFSPSGLFLGVMFTSFEDIQYYTIFNISPGLMDRQRLAAAEIGVAVAASSNK